MSNRKDTKAGLVLEVNELTHDPSDGQSVLITPPITEDYWLFRVRLTEKQAVVGFPKFGTIGIGFARERDWNCNLPYTCKAEEIADHIWHNRRSRVITREKLVEAIRLIQPVAKGYETALGRRRTADGVIIGD